MALQVWLPLEGDLRNQGLSNVTITNNGATINNNGKIGKCYSFDGTNDYIISNSTPLSASTAEWSYACWFKPTILHQGCLFSNRKEVSQTGITIFYRNGQLLIDDGVRWELTPSTAITVGAWNHIVITRKANAYKKFYLNGQLVNTTTTVGTPATVANANYFSIGMSQNTENTVNANPLNGQLNDVRVYDHCLSPKEVEEIAKGLVLHYKLDDEYCEETTNLIPTPSDFSDSGWVSYTNGYTSISDNEFGCKSITVTAKKPWCGIKYLNIPLPATGTYTLSVYCKPLSRSSTSINQTLYTNGGGYSSDQQVSVSWDRVGEWKRIRMTRTFTTTSISLFLIAYGGSASTDTVSCEWTMPQIEKKDHATPFVNGTRTSTTVYDSSGYNHNGTIVGNLTAAAGSPRYQHCTSFNGSARLQLNPIFFDDINQCHTVSAWVYPTETASSHLINFNNYYWLYYSNGKTLMYLNSSNNDSYVYGSKLPVNTWTLVTWVLDTSTQTCKVYYDGVLNASSSNYTSSDVPSGINKTLYIGTAFNGKISDVRIYATALTAAQVADLYRTSMSISSNGSIFARELVES